jgi:hypothetical protein
MRSELRHAPGGALVLALAWPGSGSAAPEETDPPYEIEWVAPEGCPSQADLEARIDVLLADQEPGSGTVSARLEARETPGSGWTLELSMASGDQRTLPGMTCEDLTDAAALLVAIAVSPSLAQAEAAPEPAMDEVEPPAIAEVPEPPRARPEPVRSRPEPTVAARSEPPLQPRTRAQPGWGLRVGGGASFGLLPEPAGMLHVAAGPIGNKWAVDVGVFGAPRVEARFPDHHEVGGVFGLWAVEARGCGVPRIKTVEFPLCLGFAGGLVHGHGIGDLASRSAIAGWVAAVGGPAVRFPIWRWLRGYVSADGAVVLLRPQLEIEDVGVLCCDRVLGASVSAGVQVRFREAGKPQ